MCFRTSHGEISSFQYEKYKTIFFYFLRIFSKWLRTTMTPRREWLFSLNIYCLFEKKSDKDLEDAHVLPSGHHSSDRVRLKSGTLFCPPMWLSCVSKYAGLHSLFSCHIGREQSWKWSSLDSDPHFDIKYFHCKQHDTIPASFISTSVPFVYIDLILFSCPTFHLNTLHKLRI